MFDFNWIEMLLRVPGLIVGITVHEFFHAWTAWKLGDDTPMAQGRVTLNPLAHLDPIGTILILFAGFGWGRPVQINPHNFRDSRRGDMLVSLLGPVSNFLVAVGFAIALLFVSRVHAGNTVLVNGALAMGVWINAALMVFNLIPLYPLDGSHVMAALLPYEARERYEAFGRYSFFVLIGVVLLLGGVLSRVIGVVAGLIAIPFKLDLAYYIIEALKRT